MLQAIQSTAAVVPFLQPAYWKSFWQFDNMVTAPSRPAPFGVSTIMMCLFFGTNFLLFLYFALIKNSSKSSEVVEKKEKKELSKPFMGTIECYSNITTELMRTGLIMAMTYICEYHWIFPHSTKSYSRDLFVFVLILFFAYAVYTIKPIHDLSLLGREQTEEWKGWMQFIFLLYHYFHAEEVYNSVRVMITCYVWMTGFGNFSFFYTKQDYSLLRVVQMFWRLNFSVLLLMWTHGNTYILYYICPMHTFYFMMVYFTMYTFSSINTTKWGIRLKLFVLAIIIYIVWDINGGLFDILFMWLGNDKVIGANSGSVWEYYFRTSLDHWSTLLGMIFALNFYLAEQYFVKAKGISLVIGAVLMGALALYWLFVYYPLEKLEYNMTHSYTAIIPLTAYIFFRNITPTVRSGVSMSLHDLGKTTLETYLLQHHIWLSSNAKTLWTITPGNPWVNFALATLVFFFTSKELYRLTMSIRGMILPDDKNIALRNGLGLFGLVAGCAVLAQILAAFQASLLEVGLSCFGLCIVALLVISRFAANAAEQAVYQQHQMVFLKWLGLGFIVCLLFQLSRGSHSSDSNESLVAIDAVSAVSVSSDYKGSSASCLDAISQGHWALTGCEPSSSSLQPAYCLKEQWMWDTPPAGCPLKRYPFASLQNMLGNKRFVFIGDSVVRSAFHGFIAAIQPSYEQNHSFVFKHQDIDLNIRMNNNVTSSFSFRWSPFVSNISSIVSKDAARLASADMLVLGASLWDALYTHDVSAFAKDIDRTARSLNSMLSQSNANANATAKPIRVWLLPTTILDERLSSDEKRQYMNEQRVSEHRDAIRKSSALGKSVHVILDPRSASAVRESHSVDGVHYTEDVYQVVGQMIANAYALQFPTLHAKKAVSAKPYVPKTTGAMSLPGYGAFELLLIFIMLFLMDSFLGIGFLSLLLGGKSYDWEEAMGPLHRKLGIMPQTARRGRDAEAGAAEEDGLLMTDIHSNETKG